MLLDSQREQIEFLIYGGLNNFNDSLMDRTCMFTTNLSSLKESTFMQCDSMHEADRFFFNHYFPLLNGEYGVVGRAAFHTWERDARKWSTCDLSLGYGMLEKDDD